MKATIGGIDLSRIVPLLITSDPIPKINRFPIRIIAGVKCTTIEVELVGKYKIILISIVTNA
jgi:hypothetical protein